MVFARPVPPARQPYWVDQWENNPQQRPSLSHISQVTKTQVRNLVNTIIPPLATPWNQVRLMDGTIGLSPGEPMTGTIVGPVQSGKTASMVGLISHFFDIGYDAVVVLTGRTNDLNLQTAIRLKNDVFDWGEPIRRGRQTVRPSSPRGLGPHKNPPIYNGRDFYSTPLSLDYGADWDAWYMPARTAVSTCTPSLFVSKKTAGANNSLSRMEYTMRNLETHCQQTNGRSLRWAIIDDECDSLTVGDITSATPDVVHEIANIGECVYVGYSATPQANLFATQGNPLFPKHFAFFLRTGHYWEGADPHPPLEICYQVDSINKMYCGGWVFHNFCNAVGINNFFQENSQFYTAFENNGIQNIKKPLMHYLLTGGARWLLGGQLPFLQGQQAVGTIFPSPHSMLINPHDKQQGHRKAAEWLINALFESNGLQPVSIQDTDDWKNRGAGLWERARLSIPSFIRNNQDIAETVYTEIRESFTEIERIRGRNPQHVARQFPDIQSTINAVESISGNIKLKILNGNHRGDEDRLDYDETVENNTIKIPQDVYTIAIGGKKLGRGITINGLCTTLFLTSSGRADDSAIQMQRWFGYRGSHLEFVKVFCPDSIWESHAPQNYDGLRERNDNTQEIYELICRNWGSRCPPNRDSPNWSLLIGQATNPSNRVTQPNIFPSHDSLSIIKYIHPSNIDAAVSQANLTRINELYAEMVQKGMPENLWNHPINGRTIGLFCGVPFNGENHQPGFAHGERFSASEIADFLDSLNWPNHDPPNEPIRHPYQVPSEMLPPDGFTHRRPTGQPIEGLPQSKDPYLLAAYLRIWESAYNDNAAQTQNGTIGDLPPNHISRSVTTAPPSFNVIIRNGNSQTSHNFAQNVTINCRRYSGNINPNTGALSAYTWVAANRQLDYGTDKRADDIRDSWPIGEGWSLSRNAMRSGRNGDPGLILISLIEDNHGVIAPVIHFSIPDGGPPVTRYI